MTIYTIFIEGEAYEALSIAKKYAKESHKQYCVSSLIYEPMLNYSGQNVLILDDFDDRFSFNNMMLLVENTRQGVKSGQQEKIFVGDTVIITSERPPTEWYRHDDWRRFFEGIHEYIKMDGDKLLSYRWNEATEEFEENENSRVLREAVSADSL
jgi:hypothetical protein